MEDNESKKIIINSNVVATVLAGILVVVLSTLGSFYMEVSNTLPVLSEKISQIQNNVERLRGFIDKGDRFTKADAEALEIRITRYVDSQCKFHEKFPLIGEK